MTSAREDKRNWYKLSWYENLLLFCPGLVVCTQCSGDVAVVFIIVTFFFLASSLIWGRLCKVVLWRRWCRAGWWHCSLSFSNAPAFTWSLEVGCWESSTVCLGSARPNPLQNMLACDSTRGGEQGRSEIWITDKRPPCQVAFLPAKLIWAVSTPATFVDKVGVWDWRCYYWVCGTHWNTCVCVWTEIHV